ncbi:restriction endonuclease subunit S [Aeromonas cavernicola]|uniref:Restriction endonuclease subunit S n=1 Tax=Aeromonas cavernicola TaxID=1006623 RepID=A0A2H9U8B0_9GAMM|nr:restriction endonuclease subunit S [Aeromonas cavernicola]PJG60238.1 restriction endonuclease subunit S [Aeromonas cavernicola]
MNAADNILAGKYKPYPAYKDSGVEWLGNIPSHWLTSKMRYMFTFGKGLTITKENLRDEGIPCVNYGEVHSKYGFEVDPTKNYLKCVEEEYLKTSFSSVINIGDFVFADTSEDIDGSGNFTQLTSNVVTFAGYHTIIVRPIDKSSHRFFAYLFDSKEFRTAIRHAVKGVKVFSITQAILRGADIWLPSQDERQRIAAFLDYETARIDRLIAQQQRLIELLKEKRQAVISHAVTKGLNPNTPMKDSGIEWLGQVPEHWIVRRLKHTASIQSGIPKGKDLAGKETITVPMLRVANVQDGYLNLNNVHEIEIETHELFRYSLKVGDVLMNEGGDNDKLGRGAVWAGQINPCIHQNHVFAIRVNKIESEWLSWLTSSSYAKHYFYSVSKQSTNLASISSSNVKETPLFLPPKIERVEIMRYLNEKLAKFSRIESQTIKKIELLQERRTALISSAVTGKIDLRGWTPPVAGEAA